MQILRQCSFTLFVVAIKIRILSGRKHIGDLQFPPSTPNPFAYTLSQICSQIHNLILSSVAGHLLLSFCPPLQQIQTDLLLHLFLLCYLFFLRNQLPQTFPGNMQSIMAKEAVGGDLHFPSFSPNTIPQYHSQFYSEPPSVASPLSVPIPKCLGIFSRHTLPSSLLSKTFFFSPSSSSPFLSIRPQYIGRHFT